MVEDSILGELDRDGGLSEAAEGAPGIPLRATTRRGLLGLVAGGTALGLLAGRAAAHSDSAHADDVSILNYALGLEYLQAAFYTEAERLGALHGPLAQQARVVGAHERAHVRALVHVLGRSAIEPPTFDFRG